MPNFGLKPGAQSLQKWCFPNFNGGLELGDLEIPRNRRIIQVKRIWQDDPKNCLY